MIARKQMISVAYGTQTQLVQLRASRYQSDAALVRTCQHAACLQGLPGSLEFCCCSTCTGPPIAIAIARNLAEPPLTCLLIPPRLRAAWKGFPRASKGGRVPCASVCAHGGACPVAEQARLACGARAHTCATFAAECGCRAKLSFATRYHTHTQMSNIRAIRGQIAQTACATVGDAGPGPTNGLPSRRLPGLRLQRALWPAVAIDATRWLCYTIGTFPSQRGTYRQRSTGDCHPQSNMWLCFPDRLCTHVPGVCGAEPSAAPALDSMTCCIVLSGPPGPLDRTKKHKIRSPSIIEEAEWEGFRPCCTSDFEYRRNLIQPPQTPFDDEPPGEYLNADSHPRPRNRGERSISIRYHEGPIPVDIYRDLEPTAPRPRPRGPR
ncbi:hypothetical protein BKA62DRAFT_673062 [Auriculariales sp. MPI-PUGE-AT-0066]|nr:hypothetical protein BKA62DRAFT_673062 [Auriculariales sp. MPI-PUGE-AT-0066]